MAAVGEGPAPEASVLYGAWSRSSSCQIRRTEREPIPRKGENFEENAVATPGRTGGRIASSTAAMVWAPGGFRLAAVGYAVAAAFRQPGHCLDVVGCP